MNTILILAILGPVSILLYAYIDYRKEKKEKKTFLKRSIKSIEPILCQTEANTGDRRYEEEYVKNGEYILNDTSFLHLSNERNLNLSEENDD